MSNKEEDQHQKELMKEAIREWLDSRYAAVGKWTVKGILSFAVAGLMYFWAQVHGWTLPF